MNFVEYYLTLNTTTVVNDVNWDDFALYFDSTEYIQSGLSLPEKGKKFTITILEYEDLSRELFKADTAYLSIPCIVRLNKLMHSFERIWMFLLVKHGTPLSELSYPRYILN